MKTGRANNLGKVKPGASIRFSNIVLANEMGWSATGFQKVNFSTGKKGFGTLRKSDHRDKLVLAFSLEM